MASPEMPQGKHKFTAEGPQQEEPPPDEPSTSAAALPYSPHKTPYSPHKTPYGLDRPRTQPWQMQEIDRKRQLSERSSARPAPPTPTTSKRFGPPTPTTTKLFGGLEELPPSDRRVSTRAPRPELPPFDSRPLSTKARHAITRGGELSTRRQRFTAATGSPTGRFHPDASRRVELRGADPHTNIDYFACRADKYGRVAPDNDRNMKEASFLASQAYIESLRFCAPPPYSREIVSARPARTLDGTRVPLPLTAAVPHCGRPGGQHDLARRGARDRRAHARQHGHVQRAAYDREPLYIDGAH